MECNQIEALLQIMKSVNASSLLCDFQIIHFDIHSKQEIKVSISSFILI